MAKKIIINDDMISLSTIPNLSKDSQWSEIFSEYMDRRMRTLYKDISALTERQTVLEQELKNHRREKKVLMNKILIYSDEVNTQNNTESIEKLGEARDRIVVINDTLDELMYELEGLPSELRQKNYELLKLSLAIAYQDLSEDKRNVDSLDQEIERLRDRIFAMKEQKRAYEESINTLYSYLHKTIGHNNTEELDNLFL